MKRLILILVLSVAAIALIGFLPGVLAKFGHGNPVPEISGLREGDIIFQTSSSAQSMAVQLATHSPYSHCGIIFNDEGEWKVFEAVQPVGTCDFQKWVLRGKESRYVIKRLRDVDRILSEQVLDSMRSTGRSWAGRDYDPVFSWDDDKLYCSELIWKLYQRTAHVRLGKPEKLGDMDLSAPQVQELMYRRYGGKIPLQDTVITPVSIFRSPELVTVFANGKWL